jgi:hypothetical protein
VYESESDCGARCVFALRSLRFLLEQHFLLFIEYKLADDDGL